MAERYSTRAWARDVRAAGLHPAKLYLEAAPTIALAGAGLYCAYHAFLSGRSGWASLFLTSSVLTLVFAVGSEGQRRREGPGLVAKVATLGVSGLRIGVFSLDAILALLDPTLSPGHLVSRVFAGYELWSEWLGLDCGPCLRAMDAAGAVEMVVLLLRPVARAGANRSDPRQYPIQSSNAFSEDNLLATVGLVAAAVFLAGGYWTASNWAQDAVGFAAWFLFGGFSAVVLSFIAMCIALVVAGIALLAALGALLGSIPFAVLGGFIGALAAGLPGLVEGSQMGAAVGAVIGAVGVFGILGE